MPLLSLSMEALLTFECYESTTGIEMFLLANSFFVKTFQCVHEAKQPGESYFKAECKFTCNKLVSYVDTLTEIYIEQ